MAKEYKNMWQSAIPPWSERVGEMHQIIQWVLPQF